MMGNTLKWEELLCEERETPKTDIAENDYRSEFENDYDRVVFSAPFRRLQDKAQVFPLERNDFIRTRLTHSMEVAGIARSIGISIAAILKERKLIDEKELRFIPVILETAGLAHDIGNPPFGHYGEETIRNTFKTWFANHDDYKLSTEEKEDFLHFDGNCQMFRILTRLQCIRDKYGFHLTYGTLATLMKYPFSSVEGNRDDNYCKTYGAYYKKFGYFNSEKDVANTVLHKTGLSQGGLVYRHPLAFVLEAADDIAYSAGDLEDGYKKKLFSLNDIYIIFEENKGQGESINHICNNIKEIMASESYYSDEKKLQMIRILLQGEMIHSTVDAFVNNYDSIMSRGFKGELLKKSDVKEVIGILKYLSKKYIFNNSEIEKIELGGEHMIKYLLNRFLSELAIKESIEHFADPDNRDKMLSESQKRMYNLISADHRSVFEEKVFELRNNKTSYDLHNKVYYYMCMLIVDYISGMTDSYCTELYKSLKGIN